MPVNRSTGRAKVSSPTGLRSEPGWPGEEGLASLRLTSLTDSEPDRPRMSWLNGPKSGGL